MKRFAWVAVAIALFAGFALWPKDSIINSGRASVSWLPITATTEGDYSYATAPAQLEFPQDLAAHDDYQTEWWYYTGNLATEAGREFGYQLTFFRRALSPDWQVAEDDSSWRSNQIYFAHFTISDIEGDRFFPHERYSRRGAGLAGAQAEPYDIWLEDWSATEVAPGQVRLVAMAEDVTLDLLLNETLEPVLQGDNGYSRKGTEAGNASYYYSIIQQETEGAITIGDEAFEVTGSSWMDHEYSTSVLSPGTVGWDWFSLQLADGSALMLFDLRKADGSLTDLSNCAYIAADGSTQAITPEDWTLEVTDIWHSPHSGADYPAHWHLEIPQLSLVLDGEPKMADQELLLSATTYWEGAVAFEGTKENSAASAQGYIEMTGYAQQLDAVL